MKPTIETNLAMMSLKKWRFIKKVVYHPRKLWYKIEVEREQNIIEDQNKVRTFVSQIT